MQKTTTTTNSAMLTVGNTCLHDLNNSAMPVFQFYGG